MLPLNGARALEECSTVTIDEPLDGLLTEIPDTTGFVMSFCGAQDPLEGSLTSWRDSRRATAMSKKLWLAVLVCRGSLEPTLSRFARVPMGAVLVQG